MSGIEEMTVEKLIHLVGSAELPMTTCLRVGHVDGSRRFDIVSVRLNIDAVELSVVERISPEGRTQVVEMGGNYTNNKRKEK